MSDTEKLDETGKIIGPLKTREEYDFAMAEIEELVDLDPAPDSFFGQELVRLVALAKEFELVRELPNG